MTFLALSSPVFIETLSKEHVIVHVGRFPLKYFVILAWNPFHLLLTIVVTVILFITYRKIAVALDVSFWSPLHQPFSQARQSIRKFRSKNKSTLTVFNDEPNVENKMRLAKATENFEFSEHSVQCLSTGQNRKRSTSICSVQQDFGETSNANVSLRQQWIAKQKNNQHKINSAFFFVSLVFIVLAIPTTTTVIFLFAHIIWIAHHVYLVYGIILCQTLFSLVFLINPFFYMLSNQFVMRKLHYLFGWNCKNRTERTTSKTPN